MDPLGARSCFLDVDTLLCWGSEPDGVDVPDSSVCREDTADTCTQSPFPYRADLNSKVILWRGDVALLNCTAVVNTSNETLTDKNPISDSIYRYAGPELQDEMQKLKGCRTGEAKLTKGFNLAARYIIHTVGPKYKNKYRTAAESSLYSCYRNVLQLAKEQSMTSVGFCVISTQRRCYPLEDATHIALRTVRRFLESHGSALEKVVFAVTEEEESTYLRLFPLYFPRSVWEEQSSMPLLPPDIGNADGEPVVPERQIRISEKPGVCDDDTDEEEEGLGCDLSLIGSHAFARMEGDVDKQRRLALQGQMSGAAQQKQHQRNYNRWLSRARMEDLSDIAALKALYQSGVDSCGRTVVVVVGRNIPVLLIDMEKWGGRQVSSRGAVLMTTGKDFTALLYFIHMMDHIAARDYILVYFHTLTGEHNHLDSDFLKSVYDVVDVKYKKNLKAFYFVHPTFRSRLSTWFFTTFTVSGLKDRVHHVDSLHQLLTAIPPDQIEIPPFVLDYDARENGPLLPSHSFSGL